MPPSLASHSPNSQGAAPSLSRSLDIAYIRIMDLQDGSTLIAKLTTIGRKSGQPRTVELRFVYHQGNFYAASSKVAGKNWCENMIRNAAVEVTVDGERFSCIAKQVTDDKLRRQILALRDSPPLLDRVVFEMTPLQ